MIYHYTLAACSTNLDYLLGTASALGATLVLTPAGELVRLAANSEAPGVSDIT